MYILEVDRHSVVPGHSPQFYPAQKLAIQIVLDAIASSSPIVIFSLPTTYSPSCCQHTMSYN